MTHENMPMNLAETYYFMAFVDSQVQTMYCYQENELVATYLVSTSINGLGEMQDSMQTPRGLHLLTDVIGKDEPLGRKFLARVPTDTIIDEVKEPTAHQEDHITTRIILLEGQVNGLNQGGQCDSKARYIYVHGTPYLLDLGRPASHGCVRLSNKDVVDFANKVLAAQHKNMPAAIHIS